MYCLRIILLFSLSIVFVVSCPFCCHSKMTFGKVNELGQFIREAEPEPDVKKSKGRGQTYTSLQTIFCAGCTDQHLLKYIQYISILFSTALQFFYYFYSITV